MSVHRKKDTANIEIDKMKYIFLLLTKMTNMHIIS